MGADNIYYYHCICWISFLQEYGDLFSSTDITDLKENWRERNADILIAKNFFNKVTPPGYEIWIEFCRNGNIDFSVTELDSKVKYGRILWFQEWNIDYKNFVMPNPTEMDSSEYAPKTRSLPIILKHINWSVPTIDLIKQRLRKANCISIRSGEPTQIGFQRNGMGLYFYDIFSNPIPIEKISKYNDSLQYVFYSDKLILEYRGGAFGIQSFPDFRQ